MVLKRRFLKARFFLTNSCTYNCVYCHNEGMGSQKKSELKRRDVGDYTYLAKILKNNFQLKCVTLTGGDPFLYKDFSLLTEKLKNLDIELVALTKGVPAYKWLNKEAKVFKNLDFVYFSIDTLDKKEFSETCGVNPAVFDVGIMALDKLVSMGVGVRINCVVSSNSIRESKKILLMIGFAKKHKISELRFIELVDIDNVKKPFIEQVLAKAGITVLNLKKPHSVSALKRRRFELDDGFEFLVLRCMCSVTLFTGEIACYDQDLYIDNLGRVNTCLEWEVDKNPYALELGGFIKKRKTKELIKKLDGVRNGLHVCPALVNKKERFKMGAGLKLGSYR